MEFLKEHLGEELYKEVSEKLKGKGVKVVDVSGGGYVSKEKYLRELGEKEGELKKKSLELEVLRKDMPEGDKLRGQILELSQELERSKEEISKYRNEKTAVLFGIKGKYVNAAISEASRLVGKETSFEKAIEKVSNDYPEWKEEGKRLSSFPLNGSGGNGGYEEAVKEAANAAIRRAIK